MKVSRRGVLGGVAGGALLSRASAASGRAIGERDLMHRLDAAVAEAEREADFSGSLRLMRGQRTVYEKAVGLADRVHRVPNTPATRFNIASIGKMFTATAILRLWTEERVDLDAPLIRYLTQYPAPEVAGRITLRHLLTHSSGLGNYWQALERRPARTFVETVDYLDLIKPDRPAFAPGDRFAYSNSGFVLLGLVVEAVTGTPFADHIRQTIFEPLGMDGSGYWPLDLAVPDRADGYTRDEKTPGAWRSNIMVNLYRGNPAGGAYATVADLTTFLAALRDDRLLSRPVRTLATTGVFDLGKGRYGLGFMEERVNGHRLLGHTGGHFGVAGEAWLFDDIGWSFALLSNSEVDGYWRLSAAVRDLLCGESPATDAYRLAMAMVAAAAQDEVETAAALYATRPQGLQPRAVFEVEAAKARHRGYGAAAGRIMQAAALVGS